MSYSPLSLPAREPGDDPSACHPPAGKAGGISKTHWADVVHPVYHIRSKTLLIISISNPWRKTAAQTHYDPIILRAIFVTGCRLTTGYVWLIPQIESDHTVSDSATWLMIKWRGYLKP